jgi:TP53 regulating kinase and related kinases
MVDAFEDLLGIEWIEGNNVRSLLPGGEEEESEVKDDVSEPESDCFVSEASSLDLEGTENPLSEYGISQGERYNLKSFPSMLKHRKKL